MRFPTACARKPDKMTEWPWLVINIVIILALISTIQLTNSVASHHTSYNYNSYWEEYLWLPRKNQYRPAKRSLVKRDITTTTATLRDFIDNQKTEPRNTNKNTSSIRALPTSNQTKSLVKNGYSTNNSSINSIDLKLPQTKEQSAIVFPTELVKEKSPIFSNKKLIPEPHVIKKCSMSGSLCTNIDNYPKQELLHIFRTSKYMSSTFFNTDSISEEGTNDLLQTRISSSSIYLQPFCDSIEEVIYPKAGENKNNVWRYIIQDLGDDKSNYKQGIRVEKCINAESPCKFDGNLPPGHNSTCVQKFIYKKLVAMDDSNEIYYETFKIPSCCACMYYVNTETLQRIGSVSENRIQTGKRVQQKN